ncbi:MAG: hypothetical protein QM817_32260 [Archangium sp.]
MKHSALLLIICAVTARAAPTVRATMPPTVVMIRVGSPADVERREKKFYEELTVALDGFMVMGVPAPRADFSSLSLATQIAEVLPEARANDALAVVWMSFPLPKQVLVHLVALGSGRAFVRTIETDRSSSAEVNLALVARELLGTAYLFDAPQTLPVEVKKVVSTVREQIAPSAPVVVAPPPPPPEPPHPLELWARGSMDYPLAGGVGAAPVARGGLGLSLRLPFHFVAGLAVEAGGSRVMRGTVDASATFLGGNLSLYRGFEVGGGKLSLGPQLLAGLEAAWFSVSDQVLTSALASVQLGLHARTENRGAAVGVSVLAGYQPLGAELREDTTTLFRTANLKLTFVLSVGWEGL